MRSEDWCCVSSFQAAPVLVVFAQRRQKSWKQLLWKQRKIAHNRLECFSFDVSFPTALEAAFQKFKDVCFWGCLINSKTCLLLKARRYMKSAEAVEHAAKAWSFLKPVNFRKGDQTWISMKTSCRARRWQQSSKQFVILRSSAFKPESIRPCGRRLATHRRMAVATVLVAVVLEVWSYRRNSGFLYKTCFSWCFTYISSCACSCTSVKWNEAGWKHEWSLCRGPASSAGGFAITERGRLCPRRWKFDW